MKKKVLCLVIVWLAMAQPLLADQPPTVNEYWQHINDARQAVRQAGDLPGAERALALRQIADQLESITSVELPDGQIAPVDNTALIAELRADNPDLAQLEAQLDALAQARHSLQSLAQPDAFDKLTEVLKRPEFQPVQRPPSPLADVWEEFNRWLDRLLARLLFADEARALGVDWVVLILGGLVLAGVACFFWRNARTLLIQEEALAEALAESNQVSAASAAKQARARASQSDYRQAMRYMYLAALLTLDERGILRYEKTLTNREALRRAEQSASPHLAQTLSPVVDTFEQVWYGFAPVDAETYKKYTEQVEHISNAGNCSGMSP